MTKHEYGFELIDDLDNDYDVIIVSVPHAPYLKYDDGFFKSITKEHGLIVDLKGIYRNKITSRKYWSL
jgi:UDP-N-acetyl-D-galactosamine dehydrogenase